MKREGRNLRTTSTYCRNVKTKKTNARQIEGKAQTDSVKNK